MPGQSDALSWRSCSPTAAQRTPLSTGLRRMCKDGDELKAPAKAIVGLFPRILCCNISFSHHYTSTANFPCAFWQTTNNLASMKQQLQPKSCSNWKYASTKIPGCYLYSNLNQGCIAWRLGWENITRWRFMLLSKQASWELNIWKYPPLIISQKCIREVSSHSNYKETTQWLFLESMFFVRPYL